MSKTIIALLLAASAQLVSAQEVVLRHSLTGASLEKLTSLVTRFNEDQKGKGKIVLQDLAAAADKRQLPHLALLDDDDARAFFDSVPRFKPIADVMKEGGQKFDSAQFLPQIADAVADVKGRAQALPMALALPVLFYNKDAFTKAGLNPDAPPKTWMDTQKAAGKLSDADYNCPMTSSRFVWVHMENLSSQHGQPVVVKEKKADRFVFNNLVQVKHLALLSSWQKASYFKYFGPGTEGDGKFLSGECAMLTGESSLFGQLKGAKFKVGMTLLPYYDDVYGVQPENVLPDGAALWALPGKKKDEYAVAAKFINFMLQPQVQRDWVRATGFLPMSSPALNELEAAGVSPSLVEAARKRLSMARQPSSRMYAGPGRNRVRELLGEEVVHVWNDTKPAKEALDNAMARASK